VNDERCSELRMAGLKKIARASMDRPGVSHIATGLPELVTWPLCGWAKSSSGFTNFVSGVQIYRSYIHKFSIR